jgi:hypothetical protein
MNHHEQHHWPPGGPDLFVFDNNNRAREGPNGLEHMHPMHPTDGPRHSHQLVNIPSNYDHRFVHRYNAHDYNAKHSLVTAYHLWKASKNQRAITLLNHLWQRMEKTDLPIILGIVNEFVIDHDDCNKFKHFITNNLPHHLRACPEPETNHEHLCALLESIHTRITALENKL